MSAMRIILKNLKN